MKQLKCLLFIGILIFAAVLVVAFSYGNFLGEAGLIYGLIWGKVMLFDLYVGFIIFATLFVVLESSWMKTFIWVTLLFTLGNIVALAYLLYRSDKIHKILRRTNDDS